MGVTTAILAGTAISTGYQAYQGNQAAKAAKKATSTVLGSRPDANADLIAANQAAQAAGALQRKRTTALAGKGRGGTVLTGPQGAPLSPPATKTLLGS